MIKYYKVILITALIIVVCVYICKIIYSYEHHVEYNVVYSELITNDGISEPYVQVINNNQDLLNFQEYTNLTDSIIIDIREIIDMPHKDYIISLGIEIEDVTHSFEVTDNDAICRDEDERIPIITYDKRLDKNQLIVYEICDKKNIYRTPF